VRWLYVVPLLWNIYFSFSAFRLPPKLGKKSKSGKAKWQVADADQTDCCRSNCKWPWPPDPSQTPQSASCAFHNSEWTWYSIVIRCQSVMIRWSTLWVESGEQNQCQGQQEHNNYIIYLIVRDRWGWHQHVSLPDGEHGGDEQGETGTQIHINVSFPIQYLSSSIHILKFQKTAIQQRKDPSCGACASYNSISLTKFLRPSVRILIQLSSQHLTGLWSNMRMTVGLSAIGITKDQYHQFSDWESMLWWIFVFVWWVDM